MAKIKINKQRCKGCELCVISCPKGLIVISDETNDFGVRVARSKDTKECSGCALCAIMCPDCAIEVYK